MQTNQVQSSQVQWMSVCKADELSPSIGVRAMVKGTQVALFNVKERLYAIDAIDPFTQTAVLSRGIVGDIKGRVVVASPLYKQHFDLATGECLEDQSVRVNTYPVRLQGDYLELGFDAQQEKACG